MNKLAHSLVALFVYFISTFALSAEQKSVYGIDYHKITYPQIIADFMYGIEPKLIQYYDTLNLTEEQKVQSLKGIAGSLTLNHMFKTLVSDIAATDPEATFVFTKLPKDDYSNLHLLAEYFRQKKEYKDKYGVELTKEEAEKSLKLYKALFGKDYNH